MSAVTSVILGLAALLCAALSGVLGMAGGITFLGVMTLVLEPAHVVPLHGVVQLASNSTRTAVFLPHVRWRYFFAFAPFAVAGAAGAALLYTGGKMAWFRPGIGVFILVFLVWRRRAERAWHPPVWTYTLIGLATGFMAIFIGATGPFIAPFFLREDFAKEEVIGTKAACQMATHCLKIPAFLMLGFDYGAYAGLLGLLVGLVFAGTLLGRLILGGISRRIFVILFEVVLGLLAIGLLASPFLRD